MKVRVCPKCGKHNSENAVNCSDCGTTLSIKTLIDTESREVVKEKEPSKQVALKYSQLIIKDESPAKLILETNPLKPNSVYRSEPSIVWIGVIALIASALLTSLFVYQGKPSRGDFYLFLIITVIIMLILIFMRDKLYRLFEKFRDTRHTTTITIDFDYNKVIHAKSIQGRMSDQRELSFTQIGKITLFSIDYSPMSPNLWPSVMAFTLLDDSNFVINSGQHDEMKFLGDKFSALIEKPLEEKYVNTPKDFPK